MPISVPDAYEICRPFLELYADGEPHDFSAKYLEENVAEKLGIALSELTTTDKNYFKQNIKTARTLLKKRGLLYSPKFPEYALNDDGKNALENVEVFDEDYFEAIDESGDDVSEILDGISEEAEESDDGIVIDDPEFVDTESVDVPIENDELVNENSTQESEAKPGAKSESDRTLVPVENTLPKVSFENLDAAIERMNNDLAEKILSTLANLDQESFERLVIDLLSKMGYRAFRNARYTNEISGDNLIHGVILEDRAGLTPIYIQARKHSPDATVGRAELQKFSRVLSNRGGKGLFATTAEFSEEAEDYAEDEHLMLIDGSKLSQLMIAKDFCVSVEKVVQIKSIDKESFNEYV